MRVHRIDNEREKDIVVGLLTEDKFLARMSPLIPNLMNIVQSKYIKLAIKWIKDYYDRYDKAPYTDMVTLVQDKRIYYDKDTIDNVERTLAEVERHYRENGKSNMAYLFDRAIDYIREKSISDNCKQILRLLEDRKLKDAEDLYAQLFSQHLISYEDLMRDPFDVQTAKEIFDEELGEPSTTGMKTLDKIIGPLRAGWFVMIMSPMGRGKTYQLAYLARNYVMQGLNVLFVTLEGSIKDTCERMWGDLGAFTTSTEPYLFYPVREKGVIKYRKRKHKKLNRDNVLNKLQELEKGKKHRGRLRVVSFPSYTASLDDISVQLNILENHEGYSPDVIIVDYIGILRAPSQFVGRDAYDYNAKRLKGLAGERKCLVWTATQGNRKTIDRLSMQQSDVPEDIRMLAHADVMLGQNQTKKEKDDSIMRLSILKHRFKKWPMGKEIQILQQIEGGKFYLDESCELIDKPVSKEDFKDDVKTLKDSDKYTRGDNANKE